MPRRERNQAEGLDWVTWLGAGLLLACTAILSFTSLADLAARGAYMDWRRWLWPLSVDLAGLVAVRIWLARGLAASARRTGLLLALAVIVLSTAGNALEHWWQGGGLAAAMGSIPPLVLACVALLIDLSMRRPAPDTAADTAADTTEDTATDTPAPTPGAGDRVTSADEPPTTDTATDTEPDTQACAEPRPRPGSALVLDLHPRLMSVELIRPPSAPSMPPAVGASRPPLVGVGGLPPHVVARAREVIAASDAVPGGKRIGRYALAAELGISKHRARQLLEDYDANPPAPGVGDNPTDPPAPAAGEHTNKEIASA